eukprot:scpid74701/ scgid6499/ 
MSDVLLPIVVALAIVVVLLSVGITLLYRMLRSERKKNSVKEHPAEYSVHGRPVAESLVQETQVKYAEPTYSAERRYSEVADQGVGEQPLSLGMHGGAQVYDEVGGSRPMERERSKTVVDPCIDRRTTQSPAPVRNLSTNAFDSAVRYAPGPIVGSVHRSRAGTRTYETESEGPLGSYYQSPLSPLQTRREESRSYGEISQSLGRSSGFHDADEPLYVNRKN